MNIRKFIYTFLLSAVALAAVTACSDEPLMPGDDSQLENQFPEDEYGLTLAVTLDYMGGRSRAGANPMEEIENYINPEKFRVLFFDNEEKFLFESKSRWVKKLGATNDYNSWLVSVPFYTSGNDTGEYEWDWDEIREKITKNKFKIAILANRPEWECFPDMDTLKNFGSQRFNNAGPFWTKEDAGVKKIIDLHHCQWDPIYTSKTQKNRNVPAQEGFYDFIMGVDPNEPDYQKKLMMGSTSCWVDHGKNLEDDGKKYSPGGTARRRWRLPSKEYPIPMYGIQEFNPITNWTKGTPFNLSALTDGDATNKDYVHKNIALLRSVVKTELVIPNTYAKPTYVNIRYCNVYARCEPMNIWDPTDEIWVDEAYHDTKCEWLNIHKYGALVRPNDATGKSNSNDASWTAFRDRIIWFFGAWADNGPDGKPRWDFAKYGGITKARSQINSWGITPPKIFNVCTQRNLIVMCDEWVDLTDEYNDGNYHYVVYMGERNVSHPSDLWNMGNSESGKATVGYWMFNIGTRLFSVPFVDYTKNKQVVEGTYSNGEPGNATGTFEANVVKNWNNTNYIPMPLLRNHVYRFIVGAKGTSAKANSRADAEPESLTIFSEVESSPSIKF